MAASRWLTPALTFTFGLVLMASTLAWALHAQRPGRLEPLPSLSPPELACFQGCKLHGPNFAPDVEDPDLALAQARETRDLCLASCRGQ